jgi:hypothetical protein
MQSKDLRKCVEHLAAHPILRRRYGKLLESFPSAAGGALGHDSLRAVVFEEFGASVRRFVGVGMAVFVGDDFLREVKNTPSFWIAPELVKRIVRGRSPLLSNAEVRAANSTGGLNLVVWHDSSHPEDMQRGEVGNAAMNAFEENYRGFRLREVIAQADCLEHLRVMDNAGGLYFDRVRGSYGAFPEVDARNFCDEPRNVGMTRELALTHGASWVGTLFLYAPPQIGLSRSEQRLLFSALAVGGTDEELSKNLKISLSAVKKAWRTIYDRVATCLPELAPGNSQAAPQTQGRGKQKKQRLLAYLREHPEELRPISRKLLEQSAAR